MSPDTSFPGFTLSGALVARGYESGTGPVRAGTVLSAEQFHALNWAVRRLWVRDGNLLPIYTPTDQAPRPLGERHVIHRGAGRYDVVQGQQINVDPLSREQAEALAGVKPQAA